MTVKRCTDCKHTKGIGYDFWCGEGHTEYEVFGAETNCPFYEFHDWSKGTPSRTEKRFREIASVKTIKDNQTGITYTHCLVDDDFLDLVNNLADKNKQLKQDNQKLSNFKNNVFDKIDTMIAACKQGETEVVTKE